MIGLIVFSVFALYCFACMVHEIIQISPARDTAIGYGMNRPVATITIKYPKLQGISKIENVPPNPK